MLPADKILKQFTKFNPTSSVCAFYQKLNFLQFCSDKVCQVVLCEHVKSSNRLIVFKLWLCAGRLILSGIRRLIPGPQLLVRSSKLA